MMIAIARTLQLLAGPWLGPARRDWAAAMRAEFEIVAEAGASLPFAAGCVTASGTRDYQGWPPSDPATLDLVERWLVPRLAATGQ